jgi:hypothetical protein
MAEHTGLVGRQEVVIVDIRMPFGSMVVFILKWFFASIPVFLIVLVVSALFSGVLVGLLGGT